MKKNYSLLLLLCLFLSAPSASASSFDLDGKHYQGIAITKTETGGAWIEMKFDDEDIDFNIANYLKFSASYTATNVNGKIIVKTKIPGVATPSVLKSTDNGATLEGTVVNKGQSMNIWALEVPAKIVKAAQSDAELDKIVGDPEGYTSFIVWGRTNGKVGCYTSEFILNNEDHSFKIICDTSDIQKILSKMHGSYKIENGNLILTDAEGGVVSGEICDNGKYITLTIEENESKYVKIVLIR